MPLNRALLLRSFILAALTVWAVVSWQPWRLRQANASESARPADAAWLRTAPAAASFARFLLDEYPETIDHAAKADLHAALAEFDDANRRRGLLVRSRTQLSQAELSAELTAADRAHVKVVRQVVAALDRLPNLSVGMKRRTGNATRRGPGSTAIVVRRQRRSRRAAPIPYPRDEAGGRRARCRLSEEASSVDRLSGIPRGPLSTLVLRSGARHPVAASHLGPTHHSTRFQVVMMTASTEATVAVHQRTAVFVPESALDFTQADSGTIQVSQPRQRQVLAARRLRTSLFVRADSRSICRRGATGCSLPRAPSTSRSTSGSA
jgi:hypothetical protein